VKCAGNSSGRGLPVEPGSFEDFEDDFPRLLVRARPGGVLRILRMRLRWVPSRRAGTSEEGRTPKKAGSLITVGTATEEGIL
jgi:hypothetical protein